jgi:hypothetical protein
MPSFLSSNSSRLGVSSPYPDTATDKQLMLAPYLCVSYEKEKEIYQPARVGGALLGLLSLAAAKKLSGRDGFLKATTAMTGMFLVGYNTIRFMEVREEMARYEGELEDKE